MLKLQENPPIQYPAETKLVDLGQRWWVAHTKARFEKSFAWDLLAKEIPYFLPMVKRTTVSGGRKRHGMVPLFTSYVFFAGDQTARYQALMTNRLCQVIEVIDQGQMVQELNAIHRVIQGEVEVDLHPFAVIGRKCRIRQGALQGVEGIIIQREAKSRLVLQISALGQAVSVEIDTDSLEPVE